MPFGGFGNWMPLGARRQNSQARSHVHELRLQPLLTYNLRGADGGLDDRAARFAFAETDREDPQQKSRDAPDEHHHQQVRDPGTGAMRGIDDVRAAFRVDSRNTAAA